MSNSIRFLGFAVLAWAGVRAASLAFYPPGNATAAPAPRSAALPSVAQNIALGWRSHPVVTRRAPEPSARMTNRSATR